MYTKVIQPKTSPKAVIKNTDNINVDNTENLAYILPIGPIINIYEKIYDCFCFIIHCINHKKICVLKSPSGFIWLPFVAHPSNTCWTKTAKNNIALIFSEDSTSRYEFLKKNPPYDFLQLIEILRLQLPQTRRFITRFIFYVRLNANNFKDKFVCCNPSNRLEWLDLDYIQNGQVKNLWGPELVRFCCLIIDKKQTSYNIDYNLPQKFSEFGSNQVFQFNPNSESPKNLEEQWFKLINIHENDSERLYMDFLEHCYPSFYMTFDSFRQYIKRIGIDQDFSLRRLFNAFNYQKNGFLSFHELLLGLVAIEPDTPHDLVRIKFVFRYYDYQQQGLLNEQDITKLVKDLSKEKWRMEKRKEVISADYLNLSIKDAMIKLKAEQIRGQKAVLYKRFLSTINAHEFRGTSLLCRSKKSVFFQIVKRMTTMSVTEHYALTPVITKKYYAESCQSCMRKKYKFAPFLMILDEDGHYEKSQMIKIVENFGAEWDKQTYYPNVLLKQNYFLKQSEHPALFFIRKIREFNHQVKQRPEAVAGFMASSSKESEQLFSMFQQLYNELEPMLQSEPRVKHIYSPCFVIGDIHGNIEDLMSMDTSLWKQFPCGGIHYLFLGDYVDRGRWSIECALYLLSMKVLKPNMVTLLRGNHEIREIQIKYTYRKELLKKYEQNFGQQLWELTNKLFDRLPLCAIIDETIFCSHGGIPHQFTQLDDLEETIPKVIPNPEKECPVAWEIMWSDPSSREHFNEIYNMYESIDENLKEGYVHNVRRGTAYFFNEKAAENFFLENHLTHIIRAHEVPKFGFMFHFEQKCITIFSCSHYMGNENDCCVLLINQEKIRIIRIDTSANNSPAYLEQ